MLPVMSETAAAVVKHRERGRTLLEPSPVCLITMEVEINGYPSSPHTGLAVDVNFHGIRQTAKSGSVALQVCGGIWHQSPCTSLVVL